ncbi:YicC domain protein [Melioribacter roseus P3M-2]|uniref:YicC domain protein n=1 Tax=Melioribacter roseus (strain DSM 23840 / JCM 17771 / VKM B-2668 / P3M-2) TaxID=1191523 RepID=I7A159_MELRP|nr:YicC/YloC family endoribonuclease [Melioribacter roseus]AFN74928.1 YicC domain protein [Melioribacter roseus P3M-2]
MLVSMTGYGKNETHFGSYTIETEIKSLNSRYLDLSVRLPKALSSKELEIREKIKKSIKRGKVYLSVSLKKDGLEDKYGELNTEAVKDAYNVLKKIRKSAGLRDKIKLTDLFIFQDAFFDGSDDRIEEEMKYVLASIEAAIKEMNKMKKAEGKELEKDILSRINKIDEVLTKIEERREKDLNEYFVKFKEKATQLVGELIDDQQRLINELAILSERYDITEECTRLRSHLKLFLDTMKNSDDAGRKLNFILQEMNREANTINSKSVSEHISHLGIEIKEEIEKIREQIQNIE